jgi:ATP-dependent Lhr-like helicase
MELSQQVARVREHVGSLTENAVPSADLRNSPHAAAAINWLEDECGMDRPGAEQATQYIVEGRAVLRAVPTQTTIVAERFFDESGGMQLVIHAPFGGRINKAWGLALRKRFCRSFNFELQAAATDNGLNISLSEQHSFPLADVFHFLHAASVEPLLEQAVLTSPIFATRWRWVAGRSLALLRFVGGKKVPPPIQRMRSDDLLAAVFPQALACQENISGDIEIPDHPLARETMKDALTEAMDVAGLKVVLEDIAAGRIRCVAVETPVPSQFSHEILNANPYAYLDDAPLEERRARAVEMRRMLPEAVLSEIGRLDPAAIAEVREQAWPDVRDADEVHDVLLELVALPEDSDATSITTKPVSAWSDHFSTLAAAGRAIRARSGPRNYWLAAEKTKTFSAVFPEASFDSQPPEIETQQPSRDDALFTSITGWLAHLGPVTIPSLAEFLGLAAVDIEKTFLRLESAGSILRGQFTDSANGKTEWCDRRLLARIHRLTLGALRKQIQPVTAAQFMRWLLRWQHLTPETRLLGERGTLEALQQLQGFEAPANSWEQQILARRIANYDPNVLDHLCLTGAVGWGRLSPHPATLGEHNGAIRRVVPTSIAPLTFFIREDSDWMISRQTAAGADTAEPAGLSHAAREVLSHLRQRGASFFTDIVRATGKIKAELETALWELVTAGMITADGFDNIRALIDPKRRAGHGKGHNARPRHSAGRWSLLHTTEALDRTRVMESICWTLLKRYGVVFREMVARETMTPRWRELLIALRRLEDQGEIRGGRFISGFLGEQFALPVAVESLRASARQPAAGEAVTISAADPLNLVGILIPGDRVSSSSGKTITLVDGIASDPAEPLDNFSVAAAG